MLAQVETADELDGEYYETFAFPRARGNRLYKNFVWFNQAFIEQYARAREMRRRWHEDGHLQQTG